MVQSSSIVFTDSNLLQLHVCLFSVDCISTSYNVSKPFSYFF